MTLYIQCEMRPSHASATFKNGAPPVPRSVKKEKWEKGCMVKGRNEPATIVQVAHAIAAVKGLPIEAVCEAYGSPLYTISMRVSNGKT